MICRHSRSRDVRGLDQEIVNLFVASRAGDICRLRMWAYPARAGSKTTLPLTEFLRRSVAVINIPATFRIISSAPYADLKPRDREERAFNANDTDISRP